MKNITVRLPEPLQKRIKERAADEGVPLRTVYLRALENFVAAVSGPLRQGAQPAIPFHATMTTDHGSRVQLWLTPNLSTAVDELADMAGVTQRAFCYSGLVYAFP